MSKPVDVLQWQGRQRGLLDIGYHLIVDRDGCIHRIRELDTMGSHTPGYNHESIAVCLVGGKGDDGKPANNFSSQQREAVKLLAMAFLREHPDGQVKGHKELKGYGWSHCPAFPMHGLRKDLIPREIARVRKLSDLLARTERRPNVTPSADHPQSPPAG